MATLEKFSVPYFKEALSVHIEKNKKYMDPVHAANSYYRSIVSTIIYENRTKMFDLIQRLRNLDQAYNEIREALRHDEE